MLIKSLKMLNFRQFKGETNLLFPCDSTANVTIILGDNTFGKTTLLQAFNWCFYGHANFDKNPNFLLNYEISEAMKSGETELVEVEITVYHEDTEYTITRSQKYNCNGSSVKGDSITYIKVSYKQADGQTESVRESEIRNVINTILPEDLSTYFFFDTERVNSITTRKDVADSVKGLLGLSILDSAIKHLGSRTKKTTVIGKIYSSMDHDGSANATNALKRIHDNESKVNDFNDQLNECKSQIGRYETRKDQLEDILRDNQTTAHLQKNKIEYEKRLEDERKALMQSEEYYFSDFNHMSMNYFSQPLIKGALQFLKEADITDKGIVELTKPTIMELLNRGRCLCGREIVEGNDAYKHLMDELNYVPPEHIGTAVRNYIDMLNSFSRNSERNYQSLENRFKEITRSKVRIQEWEDEYDNICEQIKGKENMSQYQEELNDVKARLRELNNKKERLISDIGALKNSIERDKKVYDSLAAVSDKNKQAMLQIEYAETILEWLNETYQDKELAIRENLESRVNDIFEKMYHGHRRVSIDSKYQVSLLTTVSHREIEAGESEGSNRVKNFAFIAGLVSMAKDKIISKNLDSGIDLSTEPYPLVMDAPFSNADETHTANISKVLPEIAEQVIMFVMKKDWNYAEPVMNGKVSKIYKLNKVSETCTSIIK